MQSPGAEGNADAPGVGEKHEHGAGISRRRLIKHGIGAGAAIAAFYIAPSMKSIAPKPAYAITSEPPPPVTPTSSALPTPTPTNTPTPTATATPSPTPTPVPETVTTITFFEGASGPVDPEYSADEGAEFPNSVFHTVPAAIPAYPFVDGHGAVVDFEVFGSLSIVILFSPGVNWVEVDGFMVKSGGNPDPSWQATGFDSITCVGEECTEGTLLADSGDVHGTPHPIPASSFMKSTLSFPVLPAPGSIHGIFIEANSPFALDTVRFAR